jgi:hypothetical protein
MRAPAMWMSQFSLRQGQRHSDKTEAVILSERDPERFSVRGAKNLFLFFRAFCKGL